MKKLLSAILICLCILNYSVLYEGEILALDNKNISTCGFIYDFTEKSVCSEVKVAFNNANVGYDLGAGVLKVTPKNASLTKAMSIVIEPKTANVAEYPVLAIRVRLDDPNLQYGGTYFNGTELAAGESYNSWLSCNITGQQYKYSKRWQTIIIDTTGYYSYSWPNRCFAGDWYSALFCLAADGTVSDDSVVYVDWAGAFSSVEAVNEFSLRNSEGDAGFLYDFSKENEVERVKAYSSNTLLAYDNEHKALKVTASSNSEAAPMQFFIAPQTASVIFYPVLAIRVKKQSNTILYDKTTFDGTDYGRVYITDPGNNPIYQKTNDISVCKINGKYSETEDWQTLYFDTTEYANSSWPNRLFNGNWYGAVFCLAKEGTVSEGDTVYVEWIGAFESVEKACHYSEARESGTSIENDEVSLSVDESNGIVAVKITAGYTCTSFSTDLNYDAERLTYISSSSKYRKRTVTDDGKGKITISVTGSNLEGDIATINFRINSLSGDALSFYLSDFLSLGRNNDKAELYASKAFSNKLLGDINKDGSITLLDIISLKKFLAGKSKNASALNSNFVNDDVIDAKDLTAFKRIILNKGQESMVEFPLPPSRLSAEETAKRINNNASNTLEFVASEKVVIQAYDPNYAYTHHAGLCSFKGKIYCTWSSGIKDEDDVGQRILIASSSDFYNFSTPTVLINPSVGVKHERLLMNGFIYTDGNTMYVTYREFEYGDSYFDGSKTATEFFNNPEYTYWHDYCISTVDGINWSAPIPVNNSGNESPKLMANGRYVGASGNNVLISDNPNGTNWERTGLTVAQLTNAAKRGSGSLPEASVYQTADNVLHIMLRSSGSVLWHSESRDNGNTWSDAYPTSFNTAVTMPYFGTLPDGRYFFVGTTVYDRRYPLYLYISEDGYNFDKKYVIRDDAYKMQKYGFAKGGEYGYSEVMIDGDYMYIFYSKMKEEMEITRIRLSDIP